MASPDHKAGLSVVIPNSDERNPARRKVKRNVFSSPRKAFTHSKNMNSHRQSHSSPTEHRHLNTVPYPSSNPSSSVQQANGNTPMNMSVKHGLNQASPGQSFRNPNRPDHQTPNHIAAPQSNRAVNSPLKPGIPARLKLLGVDEALKYSPLSSTVPFSSGEAHICFSYGQALTF